MFDFFSKNKKSSQSSQIKNNILTMEDINTKHIKSLYSFIEKRTGILLDTNKQIIQHKILSFCLENNISSFSILLDKLKNNKVLFEKFISIITINETYFFREKEQIIDALNSYKKIPKKELRILSLPSSSGDEVYTIVFLALYMNITNFHVVGVDIDEDVIQKAKSGIYQQRALHKIDREILVKYFDVKGDMYRIKKSVKNFTSFYQYNLFEDELFELGTFDIIFSRNMFIYFDDEKKIEAYKQLEKLKKSDDSQIYLGHADISSKLDQYIRSQK